LNFPKMLKQLIKKSFNSWGYDISKNIDLTGAPTMKGGLYRAKIRGLGIKSVVDVGASDGSWSLLCREFFPHAEYLLIEAQMPHLDGLRKVKLKNKGIDFTMKAASDRSGRVYFDDHDLWGGVASHEPFQGGCTEVEATTIDYEAGTRGLTGPFIVKLDTHGHEREILEGGREILKQTKLLIIETYNFKINQEGKRFYEICLHLKELGFMPADIVDLLYRDKDKILWQMDTFFLPTGDIDGGND
jgi:FkbM family methyltransferase